MMPSPSGKLEETLAFINTTEIAAVFKNTQGIDGYKSIVLMKSGIQFLLPCEPDVAMNWFRLDVRY